MRTSFSSSRHAFNRFQACLPPSHTPLSLLWQSSCLRQHLRRFRKIWCANMKLVRIILTSNRNDTNRMETSIHEKPKCLPLPQPLRRRNGKISRLATLFDWKTMTSFRRICFSLLRANQTACATSKHPIWTGKRPFTRLSQTALMTCAERPISRLNKPHHTPPP